MYFDRLECEFKRNIMSYTKRRKYPYFWRIYWRLGTIRVGKISLHIHIECFLYDIHVILQNVYFFFICRLSVDIPPTFSYFCNTYLCRTGWNVQSRLDNNNRFYDTSLQNYHFYEVPSVLSVWNVFLRYAISKRLRSDGNIKCAIMSQKTMCSVKSRAQRRYISATIIRHISSSSSPADSEIATICSRLVDWYQQQLVFQRIFWRTYSYVYMYTHRYVFLHSTIFPSRQTDR